jgi:hypothetical protein
MASWRRRAPSSSRSSEHRTGRGAGRGIGQRELRLPIGLLEPAFLDERRGLLQRRLAPGAETGGGEEHTERYGQRKHGAPARAGLSVP